ncbi:uncharacterized protein LOC132916981 [Rhopalosiphum padi]|uniref:uncharacterized protein LOC132916981 n=1 Tax=Rhopalosiphum padi TaxID=40932 RepID=UPI00298E78B4|nr:uncharacterized protein LOC132916981 [Rhopalosiphum padi]
MVINSSVVLFVVAMVLQHSHCKPTHRFVRENSNEDEPRINRIKEYLSQLQGYGPFGSTSQSQSSSTPTHQPDSSTSYQPDLLTSNQQETAAGPEPEETKVQPSIMARDGSTSSTGFPSYTNYMPSQLSQYQNQIPNPSQFSQYQNQIPQSINPGHYLNSNSAGGSGTGQGQ